LWEQNSANYAQRIPLLSFYDKKEALHGNGGPYDCLPCKVLKAFFAIFRLQL